MSSCFSSYFSKAVFLQILDASYCGLTTLEENTFTPLLDLKLLLLSGNPLHHLPATLFLHLPANITIEMKDCRLAVIPRLYLSTVDVLDLSQNQIILLQPNLLSGHVHKLDLSMNSVMNLTYSRLLDNRKFTMSQLNLSYNFISKFDASVDTSAGVLEILDLGANSLDCQDCSLPLLQHWLDTTSTQVLDRGSETALTCAVPPLQKNQPIFEAHYNETLCRAPHYTYTMAISIPLASIALLVVCSALIGYAFRFELLYIRHLIRIRRENKRADLARRPEDCMYDAFVCYCSKDRNWVLDVLLPGLENPTDRYKLCLHERDFRIGTYILDNIESCIEKSRRVLLVLTPNFISSQVMRFNCGCTRR